MLHISTARIGDSAPQLIDRPHRRLWNLWDMFKLEAHAFYHATRSIHSMHAIVDRANRDDVIEQDVRQHLISTIEILIPHLEPLRASETWIEADRLIRNLKESPEMTYGNARDHFYQIDARLQDQLSLRDIYVLDRDRRKYFNSASEMFGGDFSNRFQSVLYDLDEAGKCYSLDRSTACVFHLMRVMEVGIKAVARCLSIPDPIKDAERNWGAIQRKLKEELERRNKGQWANGSDRRFFEESYASLDAVRNAWRNSTMHVESKYVPEEAEHIFIAVRGFMKKLSSRIDESGQPLA